MANPYSVNYEEKDLPFADPASLIPFLFDKNGVIDIKYMSIATFHCDLQNGEMNFSNQVKASTHIHNSIFFPKDTLEKVKESVSQALGIIAKLHLLEQLKQLNDLSLSECINKRIASPKEWLNDNKKMTIEKMSKAIDHVLDDVILLCKRGVTNAHQVIYEVLYNNPIKTMQSKAVAEEMMASIQEKIIQPSQKASL
jgi:hypothetical protein